VSADQPSGPAGQPGVEPRATPELEAGEDADREVELSNEFATVRLRRVYTRNGVRLQISSPRLGRTIRLDPIALESLTWQTMDTFSAFLRDPFGPSPDA
jgi:hypothetical protein